MVVKQSYNETYNIGPECRQRMLPISSPELSILRNNGIVFAGINDIKGVYEAARSNPLCHHFLYTLEGKGWLKTQGIKTDLSAGQVWISPKKIPHQFGLKGETWTLLWWSLRDEAPWSMIRTIGPAVRHSVFGEKFRPIIEELFWALQVRSPYTQKTLRLLSELSLMFLEWELGLNDDKQDHIVTQALTRLFEKVGSQLHLPWTVEGLQETSGLYYSTDHFSRICSRHLGMTPMQKVIQMRMERARELIVNTNFNLGTIAELVGYTDSFSFSAAFKRWSGTSPRNFKKT